MDREKNGQTMMVHPTGKMTMAAQAPVCFEWLFFTGKLLERDQTCSHYPVGYWKFMHVFLYILYTQIFFCGMRSPWTRAGIVARLVPFDWTKRAQDQSSIKLSPCCNTAVAVKWIVFCLVHAASCITEKQEVGVADGALCALAVTSHLNFPMLQL